MKILAYSFYIHLIKKYFSLKSTDTLERIGAKLDQSYQHHQESRGYQLQNKMEQTSDFESESSDFGSGSSGKMLFLFIRRFFNLKKTAESSVLLMKHK